MNIFDKLLYGIKVANDNIVVLNDKIDNLMNSLSYEDEPNDAPAQGEKGDIIL